MSNELKLSILSPERKLLEKVAVEELTLTGSEGQVQILPGHAPFMGSIKTGLFEYRMRGGATVSGVISNGFFHVHQDEVSVLAETIELKSEIDLDRAKRAQKTAEETLQAADLDEHQFKKYQLKLQRAMIRQLIAGHDLH